ncbi:hypothetical protein M011DRAFT_527411 [Sporormia fimetaria CBS 119925]|uniref:Uncharacterized protein n=1 Tax=Sporormia fimetaria CBS 119925 TaxID=1340428 RepID=A0A6A6V5G6_9PLEO|nr:hypothetical protein M011DRAFT_527411 [Sporormia fimetaria CBS 119925]
MARGSGLWGTSIQRGFSFTACQRLFQRLKDTVKDDLAAPKTGQPLLGNAEGDDAPKTPARTPKCKALVREANGTLNRKPKKQDQDEEDGQAEEGIIDASITNRPPFG